MLASVILPSRGRPGKLEDAVSSVLSRSHLPEEVEVVVRLDRDDIGTCAQLPTLCASWGQVTFIIGNRYRGYHDMDRFWNELAAASKGRWLVTFNDDLRMVTEGWDAQLATQWDPKRVWIVRPMDNYKRVYGWTSFPIISRIVPEKLGHLTVFPGVDTWMERIFGNGEFRPGIVVDTEAIELEHQRPNLPGYEHLNDPTWEQSEVAERQLGAMWSAQADRWAELALKDIERLRRV